MVEENGKRQTDGSGTGIGGSRFSPTQLAGFARIAARARLDSADIDANKVGGGNKRVNESDGGQVDEPRSESGINQESSGSEPESGSRNGEPVSGPTFGGGESSKRGRGRPRKGSVSGGSSDSRSGGTGTPGGSNESAGALPFRTVGRPRKKAKLQITAAEVAPFCQMAFALCAQFGGQKWLLTQPELSMLSDSISTALCTIESESTVRAIEKTVGLAPWLTLASVSAVIIYPRLRSAVNDKTTEQGPSGEKRDAIIAPRFGAGPIGPTSPLGSSGYE